MKKILYATGNLGKAKEIGDFLRDLEVEVVIPKDLSIEIDVEESGNTLQENALLKVQAYLNLPLLRDYVIISDDTGLEIDALQGEPGIHVRRWKDKKLAMTDDEIVHYCLDRMKNIPYEKRTAQFHTVCCVATHDTEPQYFDGFLKGHIVEKAREDISVHGLPFEKLLFVDEYKKMLGELRNIEKSETNFLSHRERAFLNAKAHIGNLLSV